MSSEQGPCPNCNRDIPLTKHHLVPRVKKGKNEDENYLWLCEDCHSQIHLLYDNNYLRDFLNTAELVLADEKMIKFGKFASKQKHGIKRKESSGKRRKK